MDCTQCEHYEKYEGVEKGVMYCKIWKDIAGSPSLCGIYGNLKKCSHFTPKAKPERKCETCRFSSYNNGGRCCADHPDTPPGMCDDDNGHARWQPIPEDAGTAEFVSDYRKYTELCQIPKPPKRKEQKMWKKLKHIIRMTGTAWLLYGLIFKLIIPLATISHPGVVLFWNKKLNESGSELTAIPEQNCWVFTIIVIGATVAGAYALHRATKWYWGGEK
jgi:hypothetical protein